MNIDRTHKKWALATLALAFLAMIGYAMIPTEATGSSWPRLSFGIVGTVLMVFAGLLPLGKKLAKWKIIKLPTMQKGHIWLGMLSLPLVLIHGGFRLGGFLSTALIVVLIVIFLSGVLGLLFQHLLPLCKAGKEGKGKLAATMIASIHQTTLLMHIPLALTLLVLIVSHAVMSLFF
jgi:hypothetical protein